MNKIILATLLMFVMFTNLNASENNCTVEKCKTEKSTDKNCTVEKCETEKKCKSVKKDCDKGTKKSDTDKKSPTWSATTGTDSAMKAPACCKGKKKEEAKEEKPEMKCAGKCGAGKCGGK